MNNYYKYNRTFHFDWSPGLQNDDRRQEDYSILKSCPSGIIVSIKMEKTDQHWMFEQVTPNKLK